MRVLIVSPVSVAEVRYERGQIVNLPTPDARALIEGKAAIPGGPPAVETAVQPAAETRKRRTTHDSG